MHKEKKKETHHLHYILRKSCRERGKSVHQLTYFNSENLFPKEGKGVGGCRFSIFSYLGAANSLPLSLPYNY